MKLYIDTSVFGGYFESEFQLWTRKLFNNIFDGEYTAIISDLTLAELETAPVEVKKLVNKTIAENAIYVEIDRITQELAEIYLTEKIVSEKFKSDALHIALATTQKVDVLTSWNFKHIVNLNRIRLYNSVNLRYGFQIIEIRSPLELVEI